MAYDYAGSWDTHAAHQANLFPSSSTPSSTPFSTARALTYYKSQGVPSSKIVLGMPLYGRAFADTDGPGTAFSGSGEGSWEAGVWDYKALPRVGAQEMVDGRVGASWCYDGGKRLMVSYDNKEMVERKVEYIKAEGLGGAMWWESSADKGGYESLIGTVRWHAMNLVGLPSADFYAGCSRPWWRRRAEDGSRYEYTGVSRVQVSESKGRFSQ